MPEVLYLVGIAKHPLQLGRVAIRLPVLDLIAIGHTITYASYLELLRLTYHRESEEDR